MFAGKEIIYIQSNGARIPAIVVECVRDIGITIVKKKDKTKYLCCLIMPGSPLWKPSYNKKLIYKEFTRMRKGIISGIVDDRPEVDLFQLEGIYTGGASSSSCPFGQ